MWLRAYIAAARGAFVPAERLTRSLLRASDADVRRAACLTLASVLRQTGRHRAARTFDTRALALSSDRSARAHALIGLAADAVGLADARTCAERLHQAARAAPRGDWRAWVRVRWVRAEHALLTGRARVAVTEARLALQRSRAAGARRHEAKSLLFLGAALAASSDPAAARTLRRAERTARRVGADAIANVARDLASRPDG